MTLLSRDVQLVLMIADTRHIGRAASKLNTTQPYLSMRLREIEQKLGIVLFERRPCVEPTAAGHLVLSALRRSTADVEGAVASAKMIERGKMGRVVVGFASTAMLTNIPYGLQKFRSANPNILLELRDLHSGLQWDMLISGEIDVAITREVRPDKRVRHELLVDEPFSVAMPQIHRLALRKRIALEDLALEPFVLFRRKVAPMLYDGIVSACVKAGFSPRIVQETEEWYTALAFVRGGLGVSIVPQSFRQLSWPHLAFSQIAPPRPSACIFLCWNIERFAPAVDRFARDMRLSIHSNRAG